MIKLRKRIGKLLLVGSMFSFYGCVSRQLPALTTLSDPMATDILSRAWTNYGNGLVQEALMDFQRARSLDSGLEEPSQMGQNWSVARQGQYTQGIIEFSKLVKSPERDGGIAYCLLKRRLGDDLKRAMAILKELGLEKNDLNFHEIYPIGIGNSGIHAMGALYYFWSGANGPAELHYLKAKDLLEKKDHLALEMIMDIEKNFF